MLKNPETEVFIVSVVDTKLNLPCLVEAYDIEEDAIEGLFDYLINYNEDPDFQENFKKYKENQGYEYGEDDIAYLTGYFIDRSEFDLIIIINRQKGEEVEALCSFF